MDITVVLASVVVFMVIVFLLVGMLLGVKAKLLPSGPVKLLINDSWVKFYFLGINERFEHYFTYITFFTALITS